MTRGCSGIHTKAYDNYMELVARIEVYIRQGHARDAEADEIRANMEGWWRKMSDWEKDCVPAGMRLPAIVLRTRIARAA